MFHKTGEDSSPAINYMEIGALLWKRLISINKELNEDRLLLK